MSWPRCPGCGRPDIHVTQTTSDVLPVQPVRFRLYDCAGCGAYWHTVEKILVVRPETRSITHLYTGDSGKPATGSSKGADTNE